MEITYIYQNTVKSYDYDAYGNIMSEDGSLTHNVFTYTAREYIPAPACITTAPAGTTPKSAGSSRRTRSGIWEA